MTAVEQLTNRLRQAIEAVDVQQVANRLVAESLPLSPWSAWALIGQCRHRQRQRWLTNIVQTRLHGSAEQLSVRMALGHPEGIAQRGVVPGLIEWEYFFHGRGCCLTHRTTGESIDVDYFDDSGDYVDPFFYLCYLQSLKHPEYVEQRLIELHPSYDPLLISFAELESHGALVAFEESKAFKLAPACEELCDLIDRFAILCDDPSRRLTAALAVGDWLKAEELVSERSAVDLGALRKLAVTCRQERIDKLLSLQRQDQWSKEALCGLIDIQAPQVDQLLQKILRGRPGGTMSAALQALLDRRDALWSPDVYQLFRRLNPEREIPEPYSWKAAAEILLRTGYKTAEVSQSLLRATNRETGEAALLALEFAPHLAAELFRRALRSPVPHERNIAAAALAVLDEPWAIREMTAVLHSSSDREFTSPIRGALVCSRDPLAHQAVLEWEAKHPRRPSTGPGYTWEEVTEFNRDS